MTWEAKIEGTGDPAKVAAALESYARDLDSGAGIEVKSATLRHGSDFNPQVARVWPAREAAVAEEAPAAKPAGKGKKS